MPNHKKIIRIKDNISIDEILIKSIHENDLEKLRVWKNESREYFFHKDIISLKQQKVWYNNFSKRFNDYMFLVNYKGEDVGCMGFRLLNSEIDIYNVILGEKAHKKKGIMSKGLMLMMEYIVCKHEHNIIAKVLISNPAVLWYEKNGFKIIKKYSDYYVMQYIKKTVKKSSLSKYCEKGKGK